nr:uncharacterized protein LOC113393880 [Vanessa tameamea]
MVLCMAVFAISLWVIASPESLVQTIQLFGNSTLNLLVMDASVQVGISGALISGFIFFISAMGLYGAVTGSQFLLFMYGTLVILMMLLECALLYYFSSNITEKGLQEQDGFINHALRVQFRCCDLSNT